MPQPRVPTAILEARGAYVKHPERKRERKDEPPTVGELGEPPDDLGKEEKKAWKYLVSLLPPGVAGESDRATMEEMARLRVICKSGRALAADRSQYLKMLIEFGMTPAARSRVKVGKKKQPASDPLSEFTGAKLQ